MSRTLLSRIAVSLFVLPVTLVGCSSNPVNFKEAVTAKADVMRKGPESKPQVTQTNFSESLRCMDRLFVTYGVRNVPMLIEDITDQTKKMSAGTKDMFISAVSQMTRRSSAIHLIAYGSATDSTLSTFLANSASKKPLENIPEFATRGSVSQFDESIVKKQGDAGVSIGPVSTSAAKQATASILALDLNVIRTDDLSLLPGVVARNSVQILREGVGADGELILKKFGANFNFTIARSEGQAQALRTLIELAAIELMGKLGKVPYWTCLGTTDQDEGVYAEIMDWWESFAADPQSLVFYFQGQMAARGLYKGEIDGAVNPEFIEAIRAYQQVLSLPGDANVNFEFLKRYLAADHAALQQAAKNSLKPAAATARNTSVGPSAGSGTPGGESIVSVSVSDPRGSNNIYERGKPYSVEVQLSRDANLYCYLVDEKRQVSQFFPNQMAKSPATRGGVRVRFPGSMPFRFVANTQGVEETIACFASTRDLGQSVLAGYSHVNDVSELRNAFTKLEGHDVGMGVLSVKPQ